MCVSVYTLLLSFKREMDQGLDGVREKVKWNEKVEGGEEEEEEEGGGSVCC